MKLQHVYLLLLLLALGSALPHAQAAGRTITVTTTNNDNPPAGSVSLNQALTGLQDGDTIKFNIPGAGPHVIVTPIGGYPLIRANDITIDGYSQPGSVPNSNPILGGNNAKLTIVLDSSGAETSGDPAKPNRRSTRLPFSGYGDSENGILGVVAGDNLFVRGISFQGRHTAGNDEDPGIYCIALVQEVRNAKVQGCWFGLAPDGSTVKGCGAAVAAFRFRDGGDVYSSGLVFGTDGDGTNDVAEFNVSIAMHIALAIEAPNLRVSGNYVNVFPDGKTFLDVEALATEIGTSVEFFENGRVTDNTVIGTNGDGISDSNERNIVAHAIYNHDIEFYSTGVNAVVAGNYFGVGVDGSTQQTPTTSARGDFIAVPGNASVRIGTNGDGKSDDLEANLIYNMPGAEFVDGGPTAKIVARGNKFVNNAFTGFPFADGSKNRAYATYYAPALADAAAGVIATGLNVVDGVLTGTLPTPVTTTYNKHVIDVYVADPASVSAGIPLPGTLAGSFVEGSSLDKDPAANKFRFSLIGLPITPNAPIAVAVTYFTATGTNLTIGPTQATNALTGPLSATVEAKIPLFAPGSIESVGLTRIVPDTPIINPGINSLNNWEPYISVLGTSTFLLEGNTFADGTSDKQRYVVALQPADGKPMKLAEGFYADNGTPYKGPVNASRQDGNPGRVAGDTRPGAVNYIVGAEASPHTLTEFGSDNRWNLGFNRLADGRYGTVQTYKLDTATLTPTPLMKAQDSANGRLTSGDSQGNNQISRFGGEVVGLDNGNFVSVVEDRSRVRNPNGNASVATIFAPDGSIVKDSFKVADGDIWSNVAAFKGGFAVRAAGVIYFFDNAGTLQGQVNQDTSGKSFDRGRGDGTRLGGHINHPYVFLVGKVTTATIVSLAAWDARDRSPVATADISEPAFAGGFDRANLAVDALGRVVVSWVSQPEGYEAQQVAARVMVLNPTAKTITPVTSSFFPFINHAQSGGIRSLQMSVATTTKQIAIAAKGEINLANKPAQGADSPTQLNFYTVFSHPDPKDDPTTPAGGGGTATIKATRNATGLTIEYTGVLQSATAVRGPYTDVANATSPFSIPNASLTGIRFYRTRTP